MKIPADLDPKPSLEEFRPTRTPLRIIPRFAPAYDFFLLNIYVLNVRECMNHIKANIILGLQYPISFQAIYQLQDPEQTTSASERCDPEAGTERIFAALDKNNDGTLSQEEFVDGASVDSFLVQLLTLQHVPDPSVPRF